MTQPDHAKALEFAKLYERDANPFDVGNLAKAYLDLASRQPSVWERLGRWLFAEGTGRYVGHDRYRGKSTVILHANYRELLKGLGFLGEGDNDESALAAALDQAEAAGKGK